MMVGSSRSYEENRKAIVDPFVITTSSSWTTRMSPGINYVFGSFYAGGPALAY